MAAPHPGTPRVLLVEDDPAHALLMRERLGDLGECIEHVPTRAAALRALEERIFDLLVLDVALPDGDGFQIQRWLEGRPNAPPIVFVTSEDRAEIAVGALRSGAAHYVVKRPNYLEQMAAAVNEVLSRAQLVLPAARPVDAGGNGLVGASPALERVREQIAEYAPADAPVLVCGETGTGKELIALALHQASRRSRAPFVAVNCAGITASLFESEVFGHVRGAYTGADRSHRGLVGAACGGTLFLDEVGELAPEAQAKLLRLLENGSYRRVGATTEESADLRAVAATNRDLWACVQRGSFRPDLYYRLAVLEIHVPPLRRRREDIPALVEHFGRRLSPDGLPPRLTPQGLAELMAHAWPGNVRELRHAVQRALLRARGEPIERFELGPAAREVAESPDGDRGRLEELLGRHRALGPVARELGVSVRTLQRRLRALGLRPRDFRRPDP